MGKPRNPVREIVWSLSLGVVFAVGLGWYINSSIPTLTPTTLLAPSGVDSKPGASTLDAANTVAGRFAGHLAAQRYADAYALMARPYRDTTPLDAFTATCKGNIFLNGAQSAGIMTTRMTSIAGSSSTTFTFQGTGVLVSSAGSLDATFMFFVEDKSPRILVLSIAGIPVLDGVSGKAH